MGASAAYEGWVRHRRFEPVDHDFRYPLFLMYLDLEELPQLFDGSLAWSARRPALARFRRSDYLGDPRRPLREEVLDLLEARTGRRPGGPVRLLTQLRQFGFAFNPVSFYYCFGSNGERVDAVVAEVTNTPWGERHAYVLEREGEGSVIADRLRKEFHVSPFLAMDGDYEWRVSEPNGSLQVHIESRADEPAGVRRHALAAAARAGAEAAAAAAGPLPGRLSGRGGAHLPAGAAAEAEGGAPLPAPGADRMNPTRAIVSAGLRRIRGGRIEVVEEGRGAAFGPADARLRATVRIHDQAAWGRLRQGSVGLAEGYMAGEWDCDDLVSLVRIAAREMRRLDRPRRAILPLRRLLARVPPNTREGARRHISAHYDLGNELFASFLDETMTYSCAAFDSPQMSLREAQLAKLERVCRKLELTESDHLLEIGTGWGSLAIHAAERHGCRVTTTTISARAARARPAPRRAGRGRGPGHDPARGLPRPARALRQARLDRDDRGGRLAVLRDLLRALRAS